MNALAEIWTEPGTDTAPGDKLTIETAKTEFEFATLLADKLLPVKTVGDVWHVSAMACGVLWKATR